MASRPKGSTQKLIELAQEYIGTPYQWGGASPREGFDCSGFVQWLYGQQGITLPRVTYTQVRAGVGVAKNKLQPGDILFFEPTAKGPGHEGLYIGNGKFIESPHTGASVRISTLASRSDYITARRVLTSGAPPLKSAVAAVQTGPAATASAGTPDLSVQAPQSPAPPTALSTPGPDVQMPGSVDYSISPHHVTASLWEQAAQGPLVSPETQQMLRNAQLATGGASAGN